MIQLNQIYYVFELLETVSRECYYIYNNIHDCMARETQIIVRVRPEEKERLQAEAQRRGLSMSEVIRDYIKRLPKLAREKQES